MHSPPHSPRIDCNRSAFGIICVRCNQWVFTIIPDNSFVTNYSPIYTFHVFRIGTSNRFPRSVWKLTNGKQRRSQLPFEKRKFSSRVNRSQVSLSLRTWPDFNGQSSIVSRIRPAKRRCFERVGKIWSWNRFVFYKRGIDYCKYLSLGQGISRANDSIAEFGITF